MRPHRWQPTRLPRPWDSPGKNTGVGCHFLLQCMKVKSESEVAQSCPTLSDLMDCSLPGSSIHGVFQARVLEWGAKSCYQHPNADLGGKHTFSTLLSKYQAIAGSQGRGMLSFIRNCSQNIKVIFSEAWNQRRCTMTQLCPSQSLNVPFYCVSFSFSYSSLYTLPHLLPSFPGSCL